MDLFALRAVLTLDDDGYRKGLDDAESRSSTFASVLKANLITKGIEVCVKGLAKLGSAAAGVFKGAVDSYADYEQLVGGVETLFGSSAKKVIADADQAFKTAGMSANQYMETSIQSAASLINSLGGDQKKAAELMNLSVTDMADNVNKMGTSMEGVQNAYRGFSRGNFTMLDNLALGFAGTKEGMQQLLDKAHEISGVKYDISSYADIVQAIHVVQNEMGITGTTAKEAEKTIEGSLNSLKSAWSNLITNFGKGDGKKIEKNMGEIVTAASNVFKNVLPVAKNIIVKGFPAFVKGVVAQIPTLGTAIYNTIRNDIIPVIASAISGGRKTIANDNVRMLRKLLNNVIEFGKNIGTAISGFWDGIVKPILDAVMGFVTGTLIPTIRKTIDDLAPAIDGISGIIDQVANFIKSVWNDTLSPILQDAWKFLTESLLPNIIYWLTDRIIPAVQTAVTVVTDLWNTTLQPVVMSIWETLVNVVGPAIIDTIQWVMDNLDTIVPIVGGVMAGIAAFMIGQKITNIIETVQKLFGVIMAHPFLLIVAAIGGVIGYLVHLYNTNEEARDRINAAFEAIKGFWENTLKPAFKAIYTYVTETLIPTVIDWFENQFQPAVERVFGAIAGFWENTLKPALEALYTYVVTDLIPTLIVWWEYQLQPAIERVFNAIKGFWENTLKPALVALYDYVYRDLIPTLIVAWEYTLQPAIESVFNAIKKFWETILKPAFEAIRDFVVDTLIPKFKDFGDYIKGKFLDAFKDLKKYWKEDLEPRIKALKEALEKFFDNVIKPIAEHVGGAFLDAWKKITDFFSGNGEKSVKGLSGVFDTLLNTWLKPIADWLGGAFTTAWENFKTLLNGIVDFLTNVFSGNWKGAWDSLVNMLGTIFGRITGLLKTPINAVIDLINSMISKVESAINMVVNGINNNLRIQIPALEWDDFFGHHSIGGFNWGVNLPSVNWGRIQRLWKGGVLGDGETALVGEYAPEMLRVVNGRAIVTPLSDKPGRLGANNNISINVYPQPGQSPEQIAEQVQRVLQRELAQKEAAFV